MCEKGVIVKPGSGAKLCEVPRCGKRQTIVLIPEGTVLEVEGIREVDTDIPLATTGWSILYVTEQWLEVTYEGRKGWIHKSDTEKAN